MAIKKLFRYLAPKTLSDIFFRSIFFQLLICQWHIFFSMQILNDYHAPVLQAICEGVIVGGPFVLLFTLGGWFQQQELVSLTQKAYFDPLTQVLNRQTFLDRLKKSMDRSRCGLFMLIDADNFKAINDTHGHRAGDRCIEAIGRRLTWSLRKTDLAGRIGGDEFAVFLPDVSKEHGRSVALRLGQAICFVDEDSDKHLSVSLSIGAVWTKSGNDPDLTLLDADRTLYESKRHGRGQIRFSNDSLVLQIQEIKEPTLYNFDPTEMACVEAGRSLLTPGV